MNYLNQENNSFANAFTVSDTVVRELHLFQNIEFRNFTSTTASDNNTSTGSKILEDWKSKYTWVGEGLFDNYWAPHQSRLIVLQGIRDIRTSFGGVQALDALRSGSITLETKLFNHANVTVEVVNGTIADTWSYARELKQVQLTQNGDSYLYNTILGENQFFITDRYGVEVFIEEGR